MEQLDDRVVDGIVAVVLIFSTATWLFIFSAWRRSPILPYEPRRPVPWGAAAGTLAILFAFKPLLLSWIGEAPQHSEINHHPPEAIEYLLSAIVSEALIVGGFVFFVLVLSGATVRDVGLPNSTRQLARDTLIGMVACVAAIVPVIAIQAILQQVLQKSSSGHELVRMLTEGEPNFFVLALGAVTAVIVAPICEEITFRLLLQGGLESWEHKWVVRREVAAKTCTMGETPPTEQLIADNETQMTNDDDGQAKDLSLQHETPIRGIAGLPPGWFPILVSSLLFALAHFGYGPEPVPLFFLALVLGFVYQRTHRILPSIVAHALFNSFTMIILWRMVFHPS